LNCEYYNSQECDIEAFNIGAFVFCFILVLFVVTLVFVDVMSRPPMIVNCTMTELSVWVGNDCNV